MPDIETTRQSVKIKHPNGQVTIHELDVVRTVFLAVDCGCWKHAGYGQRFIVIITKHSAFIRRADAEHHFSEIDQSGPITAAIERLGL